MFKKAAVFTDIHFGLKGNSRVHNEDCEEFIDWYIETAKAAGCETGIFCGDWHHNRNSLNLTTMDATIRCMEKLGAAFEKFYFFDGNHDLYYKDKRDVNSTAFIPLAERHDPHLRLRLSRRYPKVRRCMCFGLHISSHISSSTLFNAPRIRTMYYTAASIL